MSRFEVEIADTDAAGPKVDVEIVGRASEASDTEEAEEEERAVSPEANDDDESGEEALVRERAIRKFKNSSNVRHRYRQAQVSSRAG